MPMILIPAPGYAHLGIDDCGDGSLVGWVAFCLDSIASFKFAKEVERLKKDYQIQNFHGRKFKISQEEGYRAFLITIRDCTSLSNIGRIRVVFVSRESYKGLKSFVEDFAEGLLSQCSTLPKEKEFKRLARACPPIYWLARHESQTILRDVVKFSVELDKEGENINLDEIMSMDSGEGFSVIGEVKEFLPKIINAMVKQKNEDENKNGVCPELCDLKIVNSKDSAMVQAADVIANFSYAQLRAHIDPNNCGKSTILRARLLEEEFDHYAESYILDFSNLYSRDGKLYCKDNDVMTYADIEFEKSIVGTHRNS